MIFTASSDIIVNNRLASVRGQTVELLYFRNEQVLLLTTQALSLYRHERFIEDELGNGLLAYLKLPDEHLLAQRQGHYVAEFQAGYVGLVDGKTLLITPVAIQLFPNKTDALYNRAEICRLKLSTE
ncbi:hypothetical protein [Gynuella sunshinyii]|uniref:Uncharacterized protein n=1 Tax=Gynuella sunshinyii YC6258 TaxID=1445510 RepID=A0A0C5VSA3_9GAMM|nr:hypothetical protein [Gynuella sunshinyii]AJQ97101.1 hypothetical Protein YC6258_05071 [Gynuella sunshinyii YC6258]